MSSHRTNSPYVVPPEEDAVGSDSSRRHDIFTDPALARAAEEDPFVRFVHQHWRQLIVALIAVAAVTYAVQAFEETRVESLQRAADLFSRAQSEFDRYVTLLQSSESTATTADADGAATDDGAPNLRVTQVEEARARLEQVLASLADAREPYGALAPVYRALLGLVGEAQVATGGERVEDPFLRELERFVRARAALDNPATAAEGRQMLEELVQRGEVTAPAAIMILERTAQNEEERSQVRALRVALERRLPEVGAVLDERADLD